MALLLFPGVPGATELFVLLIMMGVFLIVPLVLSVAAYLFGKRRGRAEMSESGDP